MDLYTAGLLVAVFAVDQITKGWVRSHLLLNESMPEGGFFRITHTGNTGSAFGFFPNQTALLMLASIVGIGILLFLFRKQPMPGSWMRTSLGLQLGGAAGNLVDRITLGEVTDFIDVGPWPVFNVADASIVTGLAILAWFLLRSPKEPRPAAHQVADPPVETPPQVPTTPSSGESKGEEQR